MQKILHVSIAESTLGKEAGFGLFAYDPEKGDGDIIFKEGEYIVPYGGEVVTETELDERYSFYDNGQETVAPYAYTGDDGITVDGALARGPGVYANDNMDKSLINSEFYEEPHLCIRATRDIYQHEEIFLDYGEDYWRATHLKYDVVDVELNLDQDDSDEEMIN
jgi:hypothetical protein